MQNSISISVLARQVCLLEIRVIFINLATDVSRISGRISFEEEGGGGGEEKKKIRRRKKIIKIILMQYLQIHLTLECVFVILRTGELCNRLASDTQEVQKAVTVSLIEVYGNFLP